MHTIDTGAVNWAGSGRLDFLRSTGRVSLRAVAELLGHKGLRMVMRYAHLAPGFLSDEVKKLDTFTLTERSTERARKRATCAKAATGAGERQEIPERKWLTTLDDFRNCLGLGPEARERE